MALTPNFDLRDNPLKNHIINGNFDFWQRVAGNTTTVNTSSTQAIYTSDRIRVSSGGGSTHNYSVVRSTDVPTFAQSGFNSTYSSLYTQITGLNAAAADWRFPFNYRMEGYDYQRLHGKMITISFWFKASITGIYSVGMTNSAQSRSLVTTFTVNVANTWEFKTVTVTLDTTGSWNFDSTLALDIVIGSSSGSNYQTSTLNSWVNGDVVQSTSSVNWAGTTGATIRIAQLSLVEGASALGATGFSRSGVSIGNELAMCQRYYEKSYGLEVVPGTSGQQDGVHVFGPGNYPNGDFYGHIRYTARKRGGPSVTQYGYAGNVNRISQANSGTDQAANSGVVLFGGAGGHGVYNSSGGAVNVGAVSCHWTADAEI